MLLRLLFLVFSWDALAVLFNSYLTKTNEALTSPAPNKNFRSFAEGILYIKNLKNFLFFFLHQKITHFSAWFLIQIFEINVTANICIFYAFFFLCMFIGRSESSHIFVWIRCNKRLMLFQWSVAYFLFIFWGLILWLHLSSSPKQHCSHSYCIKQNVNSG